jgi:hypothetical protein
MTRRKFFYALAVVCVFLFIGICVWVLYIDPGMSLVWVGVVGLIANTLPFAAVYDWAFNVKKIQKYRILKKFVIITSALFLAYGWLRFIFNVY